eukprot:5910605-Lingulodinium_polyedra.AAC.1
MAAVSCFCQRPLRQSRSTLSTCSKSAVAPPARNDAGVRPAPWLQSNRSAAQTAFQRRRKAEGEVGHRRSPGGASP